MLAQPCPTQLGTSSPRSAGFFLILSEIVTPTSPKELNKAPLTQRHRVNNWNKQQGSPCYSASPTPRGTRLALPAGSQTPERTWASISGLTGDERLEEETWGWSLGAHDPGKWTPDRTREQAHSLWPLENVLAPTPCHLTLEICTLQKLPGHKVTLLSLLRPFHLSLELHRFHLCSESTGESLGQGIFAF